MLLWDLGRFDVDILFALPSYGLVDGSYCVLMTKHPKSHIKTKSYSMCMDIYIYIYIYIYMIICIAVYYASTLPVTN